MAKGIMRFILSALAIVTLYTFRAEAQWNQVDAILQEAEQSGLFTNSILEVRNKQGEIVYRYSAGTVNRSEDLPVASSGKWVSAALAMTLVDRGILRLDTRLSRFVRYRDGSALKGGHAQITLAHLLSFQSGLFETHPCYQDRKLTLEECVHQILEESSPDIAPGTTFRYGNANFTMVAMMAQTATGKTWQEIFDENLVQPLGLQSKPRFYAKPNTKDGELNPSPGHGLRISYDDYLKFLNMLMNDGIFDGRLVLSQNSIQEIERDHFTADTVIGRSVALDTSLGQRGHYGLGSWFECKDETCQSGVTSSFGLHGFYPWLDRSAGCSALLGSWQQDKELVYKEMIELVQKLKPAIARAL